MVCGGRDPERKEAILYRVWERSTTAGIVPYSSQMNGVLENKHQTLQYQARTLLIQARPNNSFWVEAVKVANYILPPAVNNLARLDPLYTGV